MPSVSKSLRVIAVNFLILGLLCLSSQQTTPIRAQTQNLTPFSIKLTNYTVSTNPGVIEVSFTPKLASSNTQLKINWGPDWDTATDPATYIVSTSNLTTGATPLPSSPSVTLVDGSAITIVTGDLSPGTTYGFRLLSGINSTPTTVGNYPVSLETWQLGSPQETGTVGLAITTNSQIQVSGRIAPQPEQLPYELTIVNPRDTYGPRSEIEFELSLENTLSFATPVTLETAWLPSVLANGQTLSMLEYVWGSSQSDLSNTTPIYLPAENKLRWNITSVPAQTSTTIRFKLKTRNYTASHEQIAMTLATRLTNPITTTDLLTTSYYLFPIPEPTIVRGCDQSCTGNAECDTNFCDPSSGRCRRADNPESSSCQAPETSPIPTPTAIPVTNLLERLQIRAITANRISFEVLLSQPSRLQVNYGTSPDQFPQSLSFAGRTTTHQIDLLNLRSQTTYYIQLQDGNFLSEVFAITTARQDLTNAVLTPLALSLYVGDQLLSLSTVSTLPEYIVPIGGQIGLRIQLVEQVRDLSLVIQPNQALANHRVLGLVDPLPEYSLDRVARSIFSGSVTMPNQPGVYSLTAKINTLENSFAQTEIARFYIVPPLQVQDSQTSKAIGGANLELALFEASLQRFIPLNLPLNQHTSNADGQFILGFTGGEYSLSLSHPFYKPTTERIRLDTTNPNLPTIQLEPYATGPLLWLKIQQQRLSQLATHVFNDLKSGLAQPLYHDLLLLILILITTSSLLLSAYYRLRAYPLSLNSVISLLRPSQTKQSQTLAGVVIDHQHHQPLSQVTIQVIGSNDQVIASTTTGRTGRFAFTLAQKMPVKIWLFHRQLGLVTTSLAPSTKPYTITFPGTIERQLNRLSLGIKHVLNLGFEFFLVTSLLIQLLIMDQLPKYLIGPLFGLTLLALLLRLTLPTPKTITAQTDHE